MEKPQESSGQANLYLQRNKPHDFNPKPLLDWYTNNWSWRYIMVLKNGIIPSTQFFITTVPFCQNLNYVNLSKWLILSIWIQYQIKGPKSGQIMLDVKNCHYIFFKILSLIFSLNKFIVLCISCPFKNLISWNITHWYNAKFK